MGNYLSDSSSTKTSEKTTNMQTNLETNPSNTMQTSTIHESHCYNCKTTKGRDNTSLYPFHVRGEVEKQLLCLDCYMTFNRENKLFVPDEIKKEEACELCKKVNVELYTRGMVQARLCGDCIDG